MSTIHALGCSITQGFALPDVVQPHRDPKTGEFLTNQQVDHLLARGHEFNWEDTHIYAASQYAWPKVLADQLGYQVINWARRGSCFHQIARQAVQAVPTIHSTDVVIVMWTYLSRLSLQWPARTTVPYCNLVDTRKGWRTVIAGFNRFFGVSAATAETQARDRELLTWVESSTRHTYLDPRSIYDRYYTNMILQITVDGLLRSTGARVIHLSVETETSLSQLEQARSLLDPTLRAPYHIPDPLTWYNLDIDHHSCRVILDPSIPPAENDMHPSVQHHSNFAGHILGRYFS